MRKIKAIDGDVFKPSGQAKQELDLASESPQLVIDILGPRLSEERRQRIDDVVSHRTRKLAVAIEGVHDPHNTAAIIRTADAFGIQEVHIIEGAAKFKSSKKVTKGAHKWIDISIWSTAERFVDAIRKQGREILVASMEGSKDMRRMSINTPTVLVLGNESEGISDTMLALSDGTFRVPMFGFVESLNVSVAAAVAISTLRSSGKGELSSSDESILKARFYLRAVHAGYDIVKLQE